MPEDPDFFSKSTGQPLPPGPASQPPPIAPSATPLFVPYRDVHPIIEPVDGHYKTKCPAYGKHIDFPAEVVGSESTCPGCAHTFQLSPMSIRDLHYTRSPGCLRARFCFQFLAAFSALVGGISFLLAVDASLLSAEVESAGTLFGWAISGLGGVVFWIPLVHVVDLLERILCTVDRPPE